MPVGDLRVGFIGAGQMGRPMVDRLVGAGVATTVYARRPEARSELDEAGITAVASATEAASIADVLILCTFNDTQVREVLYDDGALATMRPGSVLASHVTGSPHLARELLERAPEGVGVLDVPVSGGAVEIAAGVLTLLVGGDPDHLERARPALETYGNPIIHVGGLGDAQLVKLINNLLFTVHLGLAADAADLAEALGLDPASMASAISACSGDSGAIRLMQDMPVRATMGGARPYLVKDVSSVRAVASELGVDLGRLGELASWVDG